MRGAKLVLLNPFELAWDLTTVYSRLRKRSFVMHTAGPRMQMLDCSLKMY